MKILNLKQKYEKEFIDKILYGSYLEGCTIMIGKSRSENIPEEDIIIAIREIKRKKIGSLEWDGLKNER